MNQKKKKFWKHGNHNNVYWIGLKPYIQRKPTRGKKPY